MQDHPQERAGLQLPFDLIRSGADITPRKEFRGHVTAAAVVVRAGQVLHIEHIASGLWLMPGGHLEDEDEELIDAVLRELEEETGIPKDAAAFVSKQPLHIDIHTVGENPCKGEPAHPHFDFRYLLRTEQSGVTLQLAEVRRAAWIRTEDMPNQDLSKRILEAL